MGGIHLDCVFSVLQAKSLFYAKLVPHMCICLRKTLSSLKINLLLHNESVRLMSCVIYCQSSRMTLQQFQGFLWSNTKMHRQKLRQSVCSQVPAIL